ncbi:MAG: hypothetical protein M3279_05650, partial [Actinomycetota bacterium]|nr:hypothetical protein [Actinomycetota bacterium]
TPFDDVFFGSSGDDRVDAGAGADRVDGHGGFDELVAGDGDDSVTGGPGDDVLDGGDGADALFAGAGLDHVLDGAGDDRVDGGAGTDVVGFGEGDDTVVGGAGFDVAHAHAAEPVELVVDLTLDTPTGLGTDHLAEVEGVTGTPYRDRFTGDAEDNVLSGGPGGDDVIAGGAGDDLIETFTGDDDVSGEEGDDYLMTGVQVAADVADGGPGTDECWHAETRLACEGFEGDHAPQFDPEFTDAEPSGLRYPRAVSAYVTEEGRVFGSVADLFALGGCDAEVYVERREGSRWETVMRIQVYEPGTVDSYTSLAGVPLQRPGTYRARLPSAPGPRFSGEPERANCMAAVSETFSFG